MQRLFAALSAVLVTSASSQMLPDQPMLFASRPVTPLLAYSFRQVDCALGTVAADVPASGPQLFLNRSNGIIATCPERNGFNNALIGAGVDPSRIDERNAIRSGAIGSTLDVLTNPTLSPTRSMSLELWFTVDKTFTISDDARDFVFLEWGDLDGTSDSLGITSNTHQLRLRFRWAQSGEHELGLSFRYQGAATSRNFAVQASSFAALTNIVNPAYVSSRAFMLVMTVASNNNITAYLGSPDGSFGSFSESTSQNVQNFVFPATHVIRVGSTRPGGNIVGNVRGFPGTFHLFAVYNAALTTAQVADLFVRKLPNSLPAVKKAMFNATEDAGDLINLNQSSIVFDVNGDTNITFWVNQPNVGTLRYNGVPITSDNYRVSNVNLLTYLSTPNATTGSVVTCSGEEHARFTFWATDNLCDRTETSPGSPNCKSPVAATASICVAEQNDPPTVVSPGGEFPVFAEANNTLAFTVTCNDIDNTTSVFGLDHVRIVSNSNSTLGQVVIDPSGTGNCTGARGNNLNVSFSISQTSARTAVLTFCYEAFATTTSQVEVGRDTITYQCVDKKGAAATGTLTVVVKNALLAGCGGPLTTRQQWVNGMPCYERGVEDKPVLLTLSGFDAVASHIPSRRFYKIDSLPPMGTLYRLDGTEVVAGAEVRANNATTVNASSVFAFPLNLVTVPGELTLVFISSQDAFNAICDLSIDPTRNPLNGRARCGGSEVVPLMYMDGLNQPLNMYNPCLNTATGCQLNFSVSLGYDDTPLDGLDNPFFGPSMSQIFRLDIVGVNDRNGTLTGPANLTMSRTTFDFRLNGNTTTVPLRYSDPDGDTYRVGFEINVVGRRANAKARSFLNPPSVVPAFPRMTFVEGENCVELGGPSCFFEGRAFISDLNRFFDTIDLSTTVSTRANDTFNITIWDGSALPNEYQPDGAQTIEDVDSIIHNHRVILLFGRDTEGSDNSNPLTTALWAGIIAGLFFVAMSCLAFWGCIIMRAKRGEEAAVWAVRNLLCTDVEHRKNPDISKLAAGGRKSLETAIHAEHARLARVVCCALFMRRVCPCMVKFDAKDLRVPDEEAMLQEAVNQTRKRIASIHRPKDAPGPVTATNAKSDDAEDVVAEDVLADDSIFDWERHMDEKTGRVFYYNVKTHESRWTPPTVKVHEQRKITDRTSVKNPEMHQPKPPEQPKAGAKVGDDADTDRVKKI